MSKLPLKMPPRTLDVSELDQMQEPFMVQVAKIKAGQFHPIILPSSAGSAPGVGWDKAQVLGLEQWLLNDWSGGGMYEITVTDSQMPPKSIKWKPFWEVSQYPEKIPPTMVGSARADLIPQQPNSSQVPMSLFPNGLPTGGVLPFTQQPQQQNYSYPPPQPTTYMNPMLMQQAQAQAQADADRRRLEERLNATEQALAQSRADALQRQYQADLERQRAESAATMQRLEARMAEMAQAQSKPAVSPEIEALKEQNRLLQQQAESERREREAERREREMREMIATQNAQMQAQMTMMQQQFQQTLAAQAGNKTDPMIQFMIEQNRNSIAAMERIANQSSGMIKELQPFMMGPRDMLAITRDANQGVDAITGKLATSYQNVIEMQGKVIENAMSLNTGGSPTVDLIREGVNGVKELAERYVTSSNRAKQVEAQSQAQVAQAQAQAQAANAHANAVVAQARMHVHTPPPPREEKQLPRQAGLSGPSNGAANGASKPPSFDDWRRQREATVTPMPHARETVNTSSPATPTTMPPPVRRHGRTDVEWFGMAIGEVMQTRAAVTALLMKMHKALSEGREPAIVQSDAMPAAVASGIATAVAMASQGQIRVPALEELFMQGKYSEFVDVLLPDCGEEYKIDLIYELKKMNGEIDEEVEAEVKADQQAAAEEAEEDRSEQDEDGSPSDDVADGSIPVKPKQQLRVIHHPKHVS